MKNLLPLFHTSDALHEPIIIAGPCSAESEQQLLNTAMELAAGGIKVFRAGIWKPRTKPGCFEGVGEIGLDWLRTVKQTTGMLVATEVATSAHVANALDAGIDILWIGARTAANPFAVQEIADSLKARNADVALLVKNPVNADLELWIGALMRIYNAGIRRLGAIHRGFSSYGSHLYRNMPQWHIPIELRRRYPNLPIIGDPSHIGGSRILIEPLSQTALSMGFNGIMVECHCSPDSALSDSEQQITPSELFSILRKLKFRDASISSDHLDALRQQIDEIDAELIELLARRMNVAREIGKYKSKNNMPVVQIERHDAIMQNRMAEACNLNLNPDFVRTLFSAIHAESVRQQIELKSYH